LLVDRPLGVKEVINPFEASGGADREDRDQARSNVPLAVMSLDRLVSVEDYADFARTFAGIAKADARLLAIGRRRVLHLTVALDGDGAFDRNGDLYNNLRRALVDFGDPHLALQIDHRVVRLVVASARVRLDPAYLWELVEPQIRGAVEHALGFERQWLGRGLASSDAIAAIHSVRGVEYVDLDVFDWVDEERILGDGQTRDPNGSTDGASDLASGLRLNGSIQAQPARVVRGGRRVAPAQLAYLSADVRDTLILQELT
jgi:predicted phage baseplate assembly protein